MLAMKRQLWLRAASANVFVVVVVFVVAGNWHIFCLVAGEREPEPEPETETEKPLALSGKLSLKLSLVDV